ncbi:AraC family transcriptional regulator [Maricurvus nonylphenolicus]|uniref:helix-turn-helix domain-containing protein n=1 Tax=Maricurvus nonylphenolicus TaxID=1008307 RepID=UPI0036F1D468
MSSSPDKADNKRVIPIAYPMEYHEFLCAEGMPADTIFENAGVDTQWFDDPSKKITIAQYIALTREGIKHSRTPSLGLLLGNYLSLQSHNYLGFALQSCGCAAESLELMSQYARTRFPKMELEFLQDAEISQLLLEDLSGEESLQRYNLEVMAAAIYRGEITLKKIDRAQSSIDDDEPVNQDSLRSDMIEIQFEYPQPDDLSVYQQVFGQVPFSFGHCQTRILYPTKALLRPFSFANDLSCKLAKAQCQAELAELDDRRSFRSQIQAILMENIECPPSLDVVAQQIHLSPRVLSRRLNNEGTSFQELIDLTRKRIAVKLLESSDLSVAEIGYRLGYEHPTNFTRAFKKWTNRSPKDFRS